MFNLVTEKFHFSIIQLCSAKQIKSFKEDNN